jgi:hypothetical protein
MMKSKWNDFADGEIYSRIELAEKFVEFIRKEFSTIAEEHRSLGFLNECVSQALTDATQNQFPQSRAITMKFIESITMVESMRKLFYHRTHLLAESVFQSTLDQAKVLKPRLKERDLAVGRYLAAVAAEGRTTEPDQRLRQKVGKETSSYQTHNLQTIQGACSFQAQLNRDLVGTLTAFGHSQMELYVKSIQMWSDMIEQIEGIENEADFETIEDGMKRILLTIPGLTRPKRTEESEGEDGNEADS